MTLVIRPLTFADIPNADKVVCAAFRATESRATEIYRYIKLQPDYWFAAEMDGKIVGTVGAVIYDTFAYLGMMAVDPAMQRQGIARKLMHHILTALDTCGCKTVLLDASPYGAPLYASLGFVAEGQTTVFQNDAPKQIVKVPPGVSHLREQDVPSLAQFDAPIFGATRANVLEIFLADFSDRAFIAKDNSGEITGFVFVQPHRIGPWVARDTQTAEKLLYAAFTIAHGTQTAVIIPPSNTNASRLLEQYGFRFLRSQTHMRHGQTYPIRQRELIFGQVSFALG